MALLTERRGPRRADTDVPVHPGSADRPARPVGTREALRSRTLRRFARDAVRGFVAVILLHLTVMQVSVVRGVSMEPCLLDGDRLLVDKVSYVVDDVERFDVVVLKNPRDQSVDFVKRVIGLPGDRVALWHGRLTLNGHEVPEEFQPIRDRDDTAPIRVPDGYVWVLGDNRPVSCDSREFGLVPVELLKGKVRARFWPPNRVAVF